MKRKIEDYKDQKVAIHCSTKEEWDKIVDLLPSGRSVERIHWQGKVNYGKSDTIDIDGCGWSPKKYYEDESCTIYPASDFLEEKPFKFNIGDEIKAKPGGYYISSPQHFAESHKKQYPSNETTISGKITERTQAQGFNWYRCSYGNWITEEGVEIKVKSDEIPLKQITMSMQEIQQICKEKYPIGCKYKCVNFNYEYILLQDDCTYTIVNNEIWASFGKGCLYSNGKYAELISLPKSDWNPQIGDHVIIISPKEENNWAPGMDKYVGKLAKITKKREDTSFEIDLDNAYYVWDYKPHRKFFRKAEPHEISTISKSVTKKKREITLVPLIQPKTVKVFDREENFF